jgi:hypothetical protein
MSHSLAKKIDKIVSKLANKHKDTKLHGSDPTEYHFHQEDSTTDAVQHESILQRMKSHLGHSTKTEHHHPEGVPPNHVIVNDLKDSPFEGKYLFNVHIILYLYFVTYL